MTLHTITLIGRPNVGKSTLFNRLTGRRQAIVTPIGGTTRDRREGRFIWNGMAYRLFDTGGLFAHETELFAAEIQRQCAMAIAESTVVWMMVDARTGLTPVDVDLMHWLRLQGKPVWILANKIDVPRLQEWASEFYALGADAVWPISAETGFGLGDMLDALTRTWPSVPVEQASPDETVPRIAVVGRPNVGKSSLINRLLGHERVIVSPIPGTTRDVIDVEWRYGDIHWVLLDTAGHKKRSRARDWPEKVSLILMRRALERADVVWLVLDATLPIARRDRQLAGWAQRAGKALVIVLNKMDRIPPASYPTVQDAVRLSFKFVAYAPIVWISARTGMGIEQLIHTTVRVWEHYNFRIRTGVLNRYFDVAAHRVVATVRGRPVRLKYITQVAVRPPTFALFVSRAGRIRSDHLLRIEKWIRKQYPFTGTPIRLVVANPQQARRVAVLH